LNYVIGPDGKILDAWYGYEEGHLRALKTLQKIGGPLAKAIRSDIEIRAAQAAPKVVAAASRLFQAIRNANYDHEWTSGDDWKHYPAKDVTYAVERDWLGWVRWACEKFKKNPINDVQLGKVFAGADGSPTVHYELRLKDGEILQGDLPFHWDPQGKQWIGWEGLDWHLHTNPNPAAQ
jgi:hypothetical protein